MLAAERGAALSLHERVLRGQRGPRLPRRGVGVAGNLA